MRREQREETAAIYCHFDDGKYFDRGVGRAQTLVSEEFRLSPFCGVDRKKERNIL